MKILLNNEIESFLDRCRFNLYNDSKSELLGLHVTKSTEAQIQKEMQQAGFHEFQQDPQNWPSLFISVKEWENTPYHKNISLDYLKTDHFSYSKEKVAGYELFNTDQIIKDPNRELNDSMILRAMDKNFQAIYLYQDEKDWMLDAPSEATTNNRPATKAHGNILTFGLGYWILYLYGFFKSNRYKYYMCRKE